MYKFAGITVLDSRLVYLVGLMVIVAIAGIVLANQLGHAVAGPQQNSHVIKSTPITTSNSDSTPAAPVPDNDSSNSTNQNSSRTTLNINGQDIPVPDNGSVNQTIESAGGSTQVDVDSQHSATSSGQAGNSTHSSVNINVRSHSSGSVSFEE